MTPTLDDVARALGIGSRQRGDTHAIGTVASVSIDGNYEVTLNTSNTTTSCMSFCDRSV